MFEQKEAASRGGNIRSQRRPLRQYLFTSLAVALLAVSAPPAIYSASADTPVDKAAPINPPALPDFTGIVEQVKPAVVSIRVKEQILPDNGVNPFEGTPFERFFDKDFEHRNGGGWRHMEPLPAESQGSGFFISADGYIVTNNHVVANASEVEVTTDDGAIYKAKVAGTDKKTDLALLKIDSERKFPFVTFSKEKPKIGQWIIAMGNPFGLGGTVTAGIISAQGRNLDEGPYDDFLQIDAPINRGNSGGPTFNLSGQCIGVNTAIYTPSGGSVGIAFAIPASTVESVVQQLQKFGHVTRGWLGVRIQPVTQEIADSLGLKTSSGALVTSPEPDGPAAQAGVKSGDVITAVNGEGVKDAHALARAIAALMPGSEVNLTVSRGGDVKDFKAKIGEMKESTAKRASIGPDHLRLEKLGLELSAAGNDQGLTVTNIEPGGEAAELGIHRGDLILKVDGKNLAAPQDFTDALDAVRAAGRKHALLLIRHGGVEVYVPIPVAKD